MFVVIIMWYSHTHTRYITHIPCCGTSPLHISSIIFFYLFLIGNLFIFHIFQCSFLIQTVIDIQHTSKQEETFFCTISMFLGLNTVGGNPLNKIKKSVTHIFETKLNFQSQLNSVSIFHSTLHNN